MLGGTMLNILDIFAGTKSSTQAFTDRGHNVISLELEPAFQADLMMDVRTFAKSPKKYLPNDWKPDVIWGSPPCQAFSMAGKGSKENGSDRWAYDGPYRFFGPRLPTDEASRIGCGLVLAFYEVLRQLKPAYWWRENPQGGLQTMAFSLPPLVNRLTGYNEIESCTVTYCQYGDKRMKPTHLLGVWPTEWEPRPRCFNGYPCHEAAPRGARTGTQGIEGAKDRSRVPYELGLDICLAVEKALQK